MLKWALIFFVLAIVVAASGIALTLFWPFLAVSVLLFLVGLAGGCPNRSRIEPSVGRAFWVG